MKRRIDLDDDLAAQINQAATVVREKPATVIRLAIRAGLPSVTNRFQAPLPAGHFADAYQDSSRAKLEDAIAKATVQRPELHRRGNPKSDPPSSDYGAARIRKPTRLRRTPARREEGRNPKAEEPKLQPRNTANTRKWTA